MCNIVINRLAGQHTSTNTCQRLRESEHRNIHFVLQAKMCSRTTTARTQHTKTMRVIHQYACLVFLCQRHNLWQTTNITTHREHTVRHNEFVCLLRNGLKFLLQIFHVRVLVTQYCCIRQATCIINTGMVLTVVEDIVVSTADSRNNRQISLETSTTSHRSLVACEARQRFFQFKVQVERAIQKTTSRYTRAILVQRFVSRLNHNRIFRETEVIVASQHDTTLTFHLHHWGLTRLQCVEVWIDSTAFNLFQKVVMALLK